MKTPLNPLMFGAGIKELLVTQPGVSTVKLYPGKYLFTMCGGGGAGGTISTAARSGGNGGAGAHGELTSETVILTRTTIVTINVGTGGLTYANGGNGGYSDGSSVGGSYSSNYIGGFGGGGGMPTYIMFDAQTASQSYFGWKFPPVSTGVYRGQTKRYYVTYDDPQTLYISDTPMAYTWGNGFELVNGNTYTNGQQLFYVSDSATVTVNISIVNGVVRLVGTASNAFGATVVPTDVSADFVGGTVYTQTDSPAVGDNVYDDAFNAIGTITSVDGATFEYNQNTYSRYSDIDTTQQGSVFSNVYFANGGGG
ncbi:MAG: hypothetical protein IJU89_04125, partial [Alphaproteobacteria bacterium]|nr:hypothetical protein [Alphaproteobacteria bacterium]